MYTKKIEQIMGNGPTLFILKLEPDLYPEPEKLCEHGACILYINTCDS